MGKASILAAYSIFIHSKTISNPKNLKTLKIHPKTISNPKNLKTLKIF